VIASASRIGEHDERSIAPVAAAATGFCGTSDVSQLAKPFPGFGGRELSGGSRGAFGSGGRTEPVAGSMAKTATAAGMKMSAVTASCATKMAIVRPPIRPIDERFSGGRDPRDQERDHEWNHGHADGVDPQSAGGAMRSAAWRRAGLPEAAIAAPFTRARASATRTATLLFIPPILHHQVTAVDVQGRSGDVAGGVRGGEADEIRDLAGRAQARHRERRRDLGKPFRVALSRVSSVSIMPGQTALTVMPKAPSSCAARGEAQEPVWTQYSGPRRGC